MNISTLGKLVVPHGWQGAGNCMHIRNRVDVTSQVVRLRVAQLGDDAGYYLFYEDVMERELNDLSFDTLDELYMQVAHEFSKQIADALRNEVEKAKGKSAN